MKILVTGHRGYIGPHLVRLLKLAGHYVTGVDIEYFAGCNWEPLPKADKEIQADFRSLAEKDLEGFDCICHLAAISNDPMGDLDENAITASNSTGSTVYFPSSKWNIISRAEWKNCYASFASTIFRSKILRAINLSA